MATVSPTPAPAGATRRASQRQALRRPTSRAMTRSESQQQQPAAPAPAASTRSQSAQKQQQQQQQQYHQDDSSEDEIPVPMKLSALTKALLNDGASEDPQSEKPAPSSPPRTRRRTSALNTSTSSASESRRHLRSGSVQAQDADKSMESHTGEKDKEKEPSPVRKRIVRLSHNSQSLNAMGSGASKRRSTSTSRPLGARTSAAPSRPQSRSENRETRETRETREKPAEEKPEPRQDVNTPSQINRVVRIATGSSGNRNRIGSSGLSSGRSFDRSMADRSAVEGEEMDYHEGPETVARNAPAVSIGSIARYPSTTTKTRPEEMNPQSSMRVKRVGKLPGSFLSGPARRVRRRQSEEDGEENHDEGMGFGSHERDQAADEVPQSSFYGDGGRHFNSGSPVSSAAASRSLHRRQPSSSEQRSSSRRSLLQREPREWREEPEQQPQEERQEEAEDPLDLGEIHVQVPDYKPALPSSYDQENEAPNSYRRPRPAADSFLERQEKEPVDANPPPPRAASVERKPLAPVENVRNTPVRQAPPPPPKMSVLEAATSTAGAATTTQAKQRRNVLKVNGKCYTRLDCLGRGGSAKVYRVTAENGKMFALKRVSLEHADESTMRGFRGEIDLLTRLSSVDRVIQLYDYEMNEERQTLTLVSLLLAEKNFDEWTFLTVIIAYGDG